MFTEIAWLLGLVCVDVAVEDADCSLVASWPMSWLPGVGATSAHAPALRASTRAAVNATQARMLLRISCCSFVVVVCQVLTTKGG